MNQTVGLHLFGSWTGSEETLPMALFDRRNDGCSQQIRALMHLMQSAWWLTYPSEKNVSWDDYSFQAPVAPETVKITGVSSLVSLKFNGFFLMQKCQVVVLGINQFLSRCLSWD